MAPPLSPFHTSELEWQVQVTEKGKVRKPRVDLEKCALQEMLQYNCNMNGAGTIVCVPVQRLFRRCAGGLTIEVTARPDDLGAPS